MARSADDIASSMQANIEEIDPTIDVGKGPIRETAIIPWSKELSTTEENVSHLGELYQLDNADLWEEDEITYLGRQYGVQFGSGFFSQGFLTFWSIERPTDDIPIPIGTLASTQDGQYIFQTIEESAFYASAADVYYNAERRRYEVQVAAEATVAGTDYDIKTGRITLLLSAVPGVSGVYNYSDFEGGTAEQSIKDFVDMLMQLPLGNALGSGGGIAGLLSKVGVGFVTDVALLTPANIGDFERTSESGLRAALDVYLLGQRIGVANYSYTTVGTETEIVLPLQPVLSVSNVLVNGSAVTFSWSVDNNPTRRGSNRAQDKVVLESAPGPAADVFITYTYNKLISDLQSTVDSPPIFDTDTLVRYGKPVEVVVDLTVETLSVGVSVSDIEDAITDFFSNTVDSGGSAKFIGAADPVVLKEQLSLRLEQDIGISITHFNQFNRPDKAVSLVQSIPFSLHEYADPVTVTVRT